jgi:hypothetical protein
VEEISTLSKKSKGGKNITDIPHPKQYHPRRTPSQQKKQKVYYTYFPTRPWSLLTAIPLVYLQKSVNLISTCSVNTSINSTHPYPRAVSPRTYILVRHISRVRALLFGSTRLEQGSREAEMRSMGIRMMLYTLGLYGYAVLMDLLVCGCLFGGALGGGGR